MSAVPAGVVYDYMMRVETPPPSHSQVMDLGSRIGAQCRVWHASSKRDSSGDVEKKRIESRNGISLQQAVFMVPGLL